MSSGFCSPSLLEILENFLRGIGTAPTNVLLSTLDRSDIFRCEVVVPIAYDSVQREHRPVVAEYHDLLARLLQLLGNLEEVLPQLLDADILVAHECTQKGTQLGTPRPQSNSVDYPQPSRLFCKPSVRGANHPSIQLEL